MEAQRKDHLSRPRKSVPGFVEFALHQFVVRATRNFPRCSDAHGEKVVRLEPMAAVVGPKAFGDVETESSIGPLVAPQLLAIQPNVGEVIHAVEDKRDLPAWGNHG